MDIEIVIVLIIAIEIGAFVIALALCKRAAELDKAINKAFEEDDRKDGCGTDIL